MKLVRWWKIENAGTGQREIALPFSKEEEGILINFMDDHPLNFPKEKREIFDSSNLVPPDLHIQHHESDEEKPSILLIRRKALNVAAEISRKMDIVLQNDQLPIMLPFDISGEIIIEKAP